MSSYADEVTYCTGRIAQSTALALASTNACARASHVGIANAYGARLTALKLDGDRSVQGGERPGREQGQPEPDMTPSVRNDADMRDRVVALEHVVVAMLAGGSRDQREAVHDMALFVRPGPTPASGRSTTDAAARMDQLADRSALFSRISE
ncbi:hypothetical protein ACFSGX_10920 [Sphingomonas arantia]|uniref:Clp R domain-containing protein n=1 Tax=Sphingomonas arantia TaxID=1460676 RepID=A0ABW4U0Z2_9SPHN